MAYVEGRTVYDADSHLMELPDWLESYADPDIRDRLKPLYLGGAGALAEQAVADAPSVLLPVHHPIDQTFLQASPKSGLLEGNAAHEQNALDSETCSLTERLQYPESASHHSCHGAHHCSGHPPALA